LPEAAPEPAPAAPAAGKPPRAGLIEWLTRRRAVAAARTQLREGNPQSREKLRRSRSALELADRVFNSYEPLRWGRGKNFAFDLYRQSTFWSLAASTELAADASFADLWRLASSIDQLRLPSDPAERDELEKLFVDGDFRALAELSDADQQRAATNARALAHSALLISEPAADELRFLLFQRLVRSILFVLLLAGLAVGSVFAARYLSRKPNIAAGKPWKASSSWADCQPSIRSCGGMRTAVFFHTKEDQNPWVEFDLGKPTRMSEVYVKNRQDGAADRAIPLVVELSNDSKKWRQVARRDATFSDWTAEFAPQEARYVRLRVDRRSYLHLEAVEIHP
jgi:hypothetical protein